MLEYLLERFLYRLSIHPLGRQHFVLKGGLLLAQFSARRVTRDIDILGRAFPGDEQEITRRITQIAPPPSTTASPSNPAPSPPCPSAKTMNTAACTWP